MRYTIVRNLILGSTLAFATTLALPALAQTPTQLPARSPAPTVVQATKPAANPAAPNQAIQAAKPAMPAQAQQASANPAADAAAKVVDGLMAAMADGQFETARQLMVPGAIVMANGVVLGPRDAFIDGAAHKVTDVLRQTQRQLLNRKIEAGPAAAWVLSEKLVKPTRQGQPAEVLTETMLLARTAQGWKVAHIHWSTRPAG